jgi:hypothetical protein
LAPNSEQNRSSNTIRPASPGRSNGGPASDAGPDPAFGRDAPAYSPIIGQPGQSDCSDSGDRPEIANVERREVAVNRRDRVALAFERPPWDRFAVAASATSTNAPSHGKRPRARHR